MRASRLVPLVSILCAFCLPASAQQTTSTSSPPAASDPQAVTLVQRCLAALTRGVGVNDVTLTGTAQRTAGSDDETGTATVTATVAGDSRLSLSFPSGTRMEIRNSAGAPPSGAPSGTSVPIGAYAGPDGVVHPMAGQNVMTDPTWFFPAFTLSRLVSTNYTLTYVGPEAYNGQQILHISASQQFSPSAPGQTPMEFPNLIQHLSQTDVYIDPASLLPVALIFDIHPDTNAFVDILARIQFSNYQAVNGVQVPLEIQKFLNNSLALDLQFSNATLNSGLSAAQFQIP